MRTLSLTLLVALAAGTLAGCGPTQTAIQPPLGRTAARPAARAVVRPIPPVTKQLAGPRYSAWLVATTPSKDTWHLTQIGPGLLCADLQGFTLAVGPPVTMGDQTNSALYSTTPIPGTAGNGLSQYTVNKGPFTGYTIILNQQ